MLTLELHATTINWENSSERGLEGLQDHTDEKIMVIQNKLQCNLIIHLIRVQRGNDPTKLLTGKLPL